MNCIADSIILRKLSMEDYPTVLEWSRDISFCEANGWDLNRTSDEIYDWWLRCVNHSADDFIRMGIEFHGRLIGYVDLACIQDNTAEIGIAIGDSSLWGRGIGKGSLLNAMNYGFYSMGITTFYAETHEANVRSRSMLEHFGFEEISRSGTEVYLGKMNQLIQYRVCKEAK